VGYPPIYSTGPTLDSRISACAPDTNNEILRREHNASLTIFLDIKQTFIVFSRIKKHCFSIGPLTFIQVARFG
jgi:hypothetical protein